MEKLQTPVVAGMGGAAVLAALLSFGGGERKTTPQPSTPEVKTSTKNDEADKSATPNQEGPWRAVCEEYAPYGFGGKEGNDPSQIPRGYRVVLLPNAVKGTTEVNTKPDHQGQTYKITVHKQLVGDLTSCIPRDELSKIHMIVATLPDPDKTEMRLEFDRYVDALEKGAEIRGFHYTGYWFPWRSQQRGDLPRKEDEIETTLLRNEQPGILLFHNDEGERLFIFVVGETPTSGINRIQMAQALRYRRDLLECHKKATTTPCNTSQHAPKNIGKGQGTKCKASNAQTDNRRTGVSGEGAPVSAKCPPTKQITETTDLDGPLIIAGPQFSGSFSSLSEVLKQNGYLFSPDAAKEAGKSSAKITRQFANKALCEVSRNDLLCYAQFLKAEQGSVPRTVRNRIDFFQIFLHHCGLPSLLKGKDLPQYTEKKARAYNPGQLAKLFAEATQDETDLLHFFLCTGAREQEAKFVCWTDVDLQLKTYTITEHLDLGYRPKDKEEGSLPIPDVLVEILKARRARYPKTRLIFPGNGGKPNGHALRVIKRLALRVGVNCGQCVNKAGKSCAIHPVCRQFVLHKLRKTFATTLHHKGLPAQTLQRYLRHSDLDTTLKYIADADDDTIRKTINSTFNGLGAINEP